MPSFDIHQSDDGKGAVLKMMTDDGETFEVVLKPDANGNINIEGRGPDGNKSGKIDPSGGSKRLGV